MKLVVLEVLICRFVSSLLLVREGLCLCTGRRWLVSLLSFHPPATTHTFMVESGAAAGQLSVLPQSDEALQRLQMSVLVEVPCSSLCIVSGFPCCEVVA